jgi:hypothetical protein
MLVTARIATLEKNWFVAIPESYNEPRFFFIKRDMKTIIREAAASEWLWATTEWQSNIERGEWEIGNDDWFSNQSKLLAKKEEVVRQFFNEVPKSPEEQFELFLINYEGRTIEEIATALQKYPFSTEEEYRKELFEYVEEKYHIYQKIATLPKCEIVPLESDSYQTGEYSGKTVAANIADYKGTFPVIVSTYSETYWQGNSSRSYTTYYLLQESKKPITIVTKVSGDGFGIVESRNLDVDFEKIYNATH